MTRKKSVRLLPHITPSRYKIRIQPDLESFTFEGKETIFLRFKNGASTITLHSKELDIEVAEVVRNKEKIFAKKITYDTKTETATFHFPKKIPIGLAQLNLHFRGILNDKMVGFYRSSYEHAGKTKHLATTQFEATYARRAFPCFDEPSAKAVFDVQLVIPNHLTAISNTIPSHITEHSDGYKVVTFLPTPIMSTYLLAFIVGDFEHIEKKTKNGVVVRIFVTHGKKHQAQFALSCALKTLEFYEQYFAIKYPLPTLDLIAIPDFAAGAMENWGAVTYRESALLVDPEHTAARNKQSIAYTIAHELAHQWFGNLVTMEWWTHLWLNEGFASYLGYLAVDRVFPKWDIWTQFIKLNHGDGLELDALKNTHPIEIDVHHPDEIGEIFDEVSYEKGASIIRMLAEYLGEKDFRDGLRYYLKKHSYKNASTIHLWDAFEKISKKPVARMMQVWTRRPGYPIITIAEKDTFLELRQSRFFSSPISKKQTKDSTIWMIPLRVGTSDKKPHVLLMRGKTLRIPKPNARWLKLNYGETSFFRTDYPKLLQRTLQQPIQKKTLRAVDRLGVLRDAFALAESSGYTTAEALELAQSYVHETDYTVWTELSSGIHAIYSLIANESFAQQYRSFAKNLFRNVTQNVGWKKRLHEPHTTTLLRNLALYCYGTFGDKKTTERARTLFWARRPVPADIRGAVYTLVAQYGGKKEYEQFIGMYRRETLHEEKNRIGRALGAFQNKKLLQKCLEFSISSHVRQQDSIGIIGAVWMNPHARDIAWRFLKKNWNLFLSRYGEGGHFLPRLIQPAGTFASESRAREIESFFKKNAAPGAERAVRQVLEKIRSNAAQLSRDRKLLTKWITSRTTN